MWIAAIGLGWDPHGFWFLFVATLVSFVTQFTLAYQNEQARRADELTLRNQADMMRLLVALAKEIHDDQEALIEKLG